MENKNSSSLAAFLTILAVAGWRGKLECIVLNEETNEFSINIKGQL